MSDEPKVPPGNGGAGEPEEETDQKIMDELGGIVSEARDLADELYSLRLKLFALVEQFAREYLSGKNVDHFGALIHNAFSDYDNTKLGDEEFRKVVCPKCDLEFPIEKVVCPGCKFEFRIEGEREDILEGLLNALWEFLEERGVVHSPSGNGSDGDGAGEGTGEGAAGQVPGDDV